MKGKCTGFSLVEIVVALGVFVAGVVGALALLSTLTESSRRSLEQLTAVRIAQSSAAIVRRTPFADALYILSADATSGFFVTRDGNANGLIELERDDAAAAPFYEVDLSRNEQMTPESDDASAAFIALRLRVSWPVKATPSDSEFTPMAEREAVTFNVVVRR